VQRCARLDHPKADPLVGLGIEEASKDTTMFAGYSKVDDLSSNIGGEYVAFSTASFAAGKEFIFLS
jgi:hypothetical protein